MTSENTTNNGSVVDPAEALPAGGGPATSCCGCCGTGTTAGSGGCCGCCG